MRIQRRQVFAESSLDPSGESIAATTITMVASSTLTPPGSTIFTTAYSSASGDEPEQSTNVVAYSSASGDVPEQTTSITAYTSAPNLLTSYTIPSSIGTSTGLLTSSTPAQSTTPTVAITPASPQGLSPGITAAIAVPSSVLGIVITASIIYLLWRVNNRWRAKQNRIAWERIERDQRRHSAEHIGVTDASHAGYTVSQTHASYRPRPV